MIVLFCICGKYSDSGNILKLPRVFKGFKAGLFQSHTVCIEKSSFNGTRTYSTGSNHQSQLQFYRSGCAGIVMIQNPIFSERTCPLFKTQHTFKQYQQLHVLAILMDIVDLYSRK
jgi:hypothetical protein